MVTRRQLGLGAFAAAASHAAQSGRGSKLATTVDQNPIRRRGTGLRAFDRSLACPGLTLFAPMNGRICSGYVLEMSKDGRSIWEWRTWEHLDPAEYPIAFPENLRAEWTHGNAIVELPDGNLLVSFRNISTIIKIDRPSGRVVWK